MRKSSRLPFSAIAEILGTAPSGAAVRFPHRAAFRNTQPVSYDRAPMAAPSAQFSITLRVELTQRPGMLGEVASAIGRTGGSIRGVDTVELGDYKAIRDITVDSADRDHADAIIAAVEEV